jgi:hypothetical protein
MIVNQVNFTEAMFILFYGCKMTEYNSHCFSSRDIQFENWGMSKAQDSIDAMRTAGYDPVLLTTILKHECIGYDYRLPVNSILKQVIDDQFSIVIDDHLYELGRKFQIEHQIAAILRQIFRYRKVSER